MNLSAEQHEIACRSIATTHLIVTKFPSQELWINHVLVIAFNAILLITTIILNAVPIITIWKSSQLNRKPCYFIILVQSFIDLAVGLVSIPLFIFYLSSFFRGKEHYCSVANLALLFTIVPAGLSAIALIALTFERYVAIVHPYSYSTGVTKKKLLTFIACCSAIEISLLILGHWIQLVFRVYSLIRRILIFLLIVFAYTRIYLVVRKISRSHAQCKPEDSFSDENLTRLKLFLREVKQAKACFAVAICFFVLNFLPLVIAIPVYPMLGKSEGLALRAWTLTLGFANSSANSVIFFWTKTMLKKEAMKIFKATTSW
jgi:hypothetical protein